MTWWENTDEYWSDRSLPLVFSHEAGPYGVALVRVWKNGKTDPGWGGEKFIENYSRKIFDTDRILEGHEKDLHAFAIVMRSVRMVCIDIDGKNGGLEGVNALGNLPYTLAETSKSGNGYHLFYKVPETWEADAGFARFKDRIGLAQGVDMRSTGCVYHHKGQQWNGRNIANLPWHLTNMLEKREQAAANVVAVIEKTLESGDVEEILMMQDQLKDELAKPISQGKRNNTLFAIGSQMFLAGVPDWKEALHARALAVGLDKDEADKLVANVGKYATS